MSVDYLWTYYSMDAPSQSNSSSTYRHDPSSASSRYYEDSATGLLQEHDCEALEPTFVSGGPLQEGCSRDIGDLCQTYLGSHGAPGGFDYSQQEGMAQHHGAHGYFPEGARPKNGEKKKKKKKEALSSDDYPDEREGENSTNRSRVRSAAKKGERGPKSWEFLVRLLAHEKTNPTLIRWEDEDQATFLLVQPDIIAQMWGARSGNPDLSYNNFARTLRYHYNSGVLEAVSERQFMYKCGEKAVEYYRQLKEEPYL